MHKNKLPTLRSTKEMIKQQEARMMESASLNRRYLRFPLDGSFSSSSLSLKLQSKNYLAIASASLALIQTRTYKIDSTPTIDDNFKQQKRKISFIKTKKVDLFSFSSSLSSLVVLVSSIIIILLAINNLLVTCDYQYQAPANLTSSEPAPIINSLELRASTEQLVRESNSLGE